MTDLMAPYIAEDDSTSSASPDRAAGAAARGEKPSQDEVFDPSWAALTATPLGSAPDAGPEESFDDQSAVNEPETEDQSDEVFDEEALNEELFDEETLDSEEIEANDEIPPANFHVYMAATPAEFDEIGLEISGVDIGSAGSDAGGWTPVMTDARMIDVLALQNDAITLLGATDLAPGSYAQMRLFISGAEVVSGTEDLTVLMPLSLRDGIEVDVAFDVEAGSSYAVILDFDALASLQLDGLGLHLRPSITLQSLTTTTGGFSSTDEGTTSADAGAP